MTLKIHNIGLSLNLMFALEHRLVVPCSSFVRMRGKCHFLLNVMVFV